MRKAVMLLAMLLTGCGANAPSPRGDHFGPGEWKVESWTESGQGSNRGQPGADKIQTVRLSLKDARLPPKQVLFTRLFPDAPKGDLQFEDGKVTGSIERPGMDDISAQSVPVNGTYARDKFHLAFTATLYGVEVRQVVEGRLVVPPA